MVVDSKMVYTCNTLRIVAALLVAQFVQNGLSQTILVTNDEEHMEFLFPSFGGEPPPLHGLPPLATHENAHTTTPRQQTIDAGNMAPSSGENTQPGAQTEKDGSPPTRVGYDSDTTLITNESPRVVTVDSSRAGSTHIGFANFWVTLLVTIATWSLQQL